MFRRFCVASILIASIFVCTPVYPWAAEFARGVPIVQQPDYPSGLADLLNSGGRVYGYFVNANDWFFYIGDTDAFNRFILQYSGLKKTPLNLLLHPGRTTIGSFGTGDKRIPYDWQVNVFTRGWHPQAPPDPTGKRGRSVVAVEAWLGGKIKLADLKVPLNVKISAGDANEDLRKFIDAHKAIRLQQETVSLPVIETVPRILPKDVASELSSSPQPLPEGTTALVPQKPQYAKVAINQDRTKILSVMFDVSQGAQSGYDILWADVNFNGKFDENEKFQRTGPAPISTSVQTGLILLSASTNFPPIRLDVPHNGKAEGVPNPCEITFSYSDPLSIIRSGEITYGRLRTTALTTDGSALPKAEADFRVRSVIRLREGSAVWEYSSEGKLNTAESLEKAPVWSFNDKPTLQITVQRDGRKLSNAGIGLRLLTGENRFEAKKEANPVDAHVEIAKPDGEILHKGDAPLSQFSFG